MKEEKMAYVYTAGAEGLLAEMFEGGVFSCITPERIPERGPIPESSGGPKLLVSLFAAKLSEDMARWNLRTLSRLCPKDVARFGFGIVAECHGRLFGDPRGCLVDAGPFFRIVSGNVCTAHLFIAGRFRDASGYLERSFEMPMRSLSPNFPALLRKRGVSQDLMTMLMMFGVSEDARKSLIGEELQSDMRRFFFSLLDEPASGTCFFRRRSDRTKGGKHV